MTGASASGTHAGSGRPVRDLSIDLLRTIAILEVILAHVALPPWLAQTRNFGVPLLILLSGWSIGLSLARRQPGYGSYLLHRLKRVALPAWGFLAFYFTLFAITDALGISAAGHQPARILDSFLFGNGIGYVWVIRVNLLLALVTLPLARLARGMESDTRYLALVLAALIANELLYAGYVATGGRGGLGQILANTPFYLIGYGAIFALGLRLPHLSRRMLVMALAVAASAFVLLGALFAARSGSFVPTQSFKYPPQLYYLAYALAVSLLLVAVKDPLTRLAAKGPARAAVGFIGAHTLPIYLWHILALQVVGGLAARGILPQHPLADFVAVAALSIGAAWLQSRATARIAARLARLQARPGLARPG